MKSEIGELHKGAIFLAEVKRRLFREGFTVAIPEPDLGDDLWVADVGVTDPEENGSTCKIEAIEPKLLRCQLKSALSTTTNYGDASYTVNFTKSWNVRLAKGFYYIIGLFDSQLVRNDYHVVCLPSKFVHTLVDEGKVRFNEKGRPMFDFFLSPTDNYPKYSLRLRPAARYEHNGPRADLVQFVLSEKSTFRAAFTRCDAWDGNVKLAPPKPRAPRGKHNPKKPILDMSTP